jgi:hypothetical protein
MNRAMYERVYGKPYEMDDKDRAILAQRIAEWQAYEGGPRVGEYVVTPKGYLRFTHDWDDSIQTTVKPGYDQSFFFGKGGYMSFSGSLDPAIPKDQLELTSEIREGACWFFSHDHMEAHNGVYGQTVPCRVWRQRA